MFSEKGKEDVRLYEDNIDEYWNVWNEDGIIDPDKGYVVNMNTTKRGLINLTLISLFLLMVTGISIKYDFLFITMISVVTFGVVLITLIKEIYFTSATLCVTKDSFVFDRPGQHKEIKFSDVKCYKEHPGNVYGRCFIYSNHQGKIWFANNIEASSYLLPFIKSSFPNK
ncbi:MAG: hypothetical protein IK017_03820 [Paludibacteraceae bacterium]|nr:hypothetical protein [Paludibacteraceae bacterium]